MNNKMGDIVEFCQDVSFPGRYGHGKPNLSFQNIDDELDNPAHKYTAPEGELIVAIDNNKVLGMAAYHRHSKDRCEMKRLYVCPESRGMHLGNALITELLVHAKNAGYKEIVLDTIVPLKVAIFLYKKHGFKECEAYYQNPMNDVTYEILCTSKNFSKEDYNESLISYFKIFKKKRYQ